MNSMNPLNRSVTTGIPFAGIQKPGKTGKTSVESASFQELLMQEVSAGQQNQSLVFSKHAQIRAEQRGIPISQEDMQRLDGAVAKAQEKGLTDTLVLLNDTAFIVNVPNKVVVTVVDGAETKSTVFTNINGVVII